MTPLANKHRDRKAEEAILPEKQPNAGHDEAGYQEACG
jgi:hypothetical protein